PSGPSPRAPPHDPGVGMGTYLGIDFGTSNTHVAFCDDRGGGPLAPAAVRLGGRPPTTTCVPWRHPALADGDVVAVGTVAMRTRGQFEARERARHRFAFGFEPDLVRSEEARADAAAFLRRVCREVAGVYPRVVAGG